MRGISVVVVLVGSVVVAVVLALRARASGAGGRAASVLRRVAAVLTVAVAAVGAGPAWRDGGAFALALTGIPVACAGAVLAVDLAGRSAARWVAPVTWLAAVVLLVWAVLTALGTGFDLGVPAVLMVAAAVASTPRRRTRPAPTARGGRR